MPWPRRQRTTTKRSQQRLQRRMRGWAAQTLQASSSSSSRLHSAFSHAGNKDCADRWSAKPRRKKRKKLQPTFNLTPTPSACNSSSACHDCQTIDEWQQVVLSHVVEGVAPFVAVSRHYGNSISLGSPYRPRVACRSRAKSPAAQLNDHLCVCHVPLTHIFPTIS